MILTWSGDYVGTVGLTAEPRDYDGDPPFQRYWFDASPKTIHADREAIASFLVFGRYMGGHVQFPHKFSPAVDVAMRSASKPVPTQFSPVEYYPKALPLGSRPLDLSWTGMPLGAPAIDPAEDAAYFRLERSDQSSGSIRTFRGLTVSSNAWIHAGDDWRELSSILPYIAGAVMFAEDLNADSIRLRGYYDETSKDWLRLRLLLASARLGIEQVDPEL